MVELMPNGVITCDPESLEITYLNKFSRDTLKGLEQHLSVSAEQLMGQNIDVFHENRAVVLISAMFESIGHSH